MKAEGEEEMNAYFYAPRYRPPSWMLPPGWCLVERGQHHNPSLRTDLPFGDHRYGVIMYRRQLTEIECEQHELDKV